MLREICGIPAPHYSLDALFARSEPPVRRLFDKFAKMVRACGPVTLYAQKTKIVFQGRVRFAGAGPRKTYLRVSFWFTERHNNPRFVRIDTYYPRAHVHVLRIDSEKDLNREVARWTREAYDVGQQKHLENRPSPRR